MHDEHCTLVSIFVRVVVLLSMCMLFSFHIEWKWPLEDEGTVKNCEIGAQAGRIAGTVGQDGGA